MRVIATFLGPYAPDALPSHVSVFSHDFKRFERLTKLATSSTTGWTEGAMASEGEQGDAGDYGSTPVQWPESFICRDCSAGRFLILKESAFSGLLGKE